MLNEKRHKLPQSEKRTFFPTSKILTSQIRKNAQDHAIAIVSTWAKGIYSRKIKRTISKLKFKGDLSEDQAKSLYTIGKNLLHEPWKHITQEHIDLYHQILDEHGGKKPSVRSDMPMQMSEMTSRLETPEEATHPDWWLSISTLTPRKRLLLPLVGNPYVKSPEEVSKTILVRKKRGRWRFQVVEKRDYPEPQIPEEPKGKIGIDIGLNVLCTLSNGNQFGKEFKPKFDGLYKRTKELRSNRQKQGLRDNSGRLQRMEDRLSGMIKTETRRIANRLKELYPEHIFVLEDLNLSGTRGQKRFAYRALQQALSEKVAVEYVNPAYTSQTCPSCGHVSRKNRSGVRFECDNCGRKAHADWVG
ncbi:MAG: transposase, partial [Bacteroidota bacterium]